MEKSGPELSRKSDSLRSGWLARDRDRSRRPFTTYGAKLVGTEARRREAYLSLFLGLETFGKGQ
jgi:hypothetical protein